LPEFPPAIFLQNRPEVGDVSRGEVVSINDFYRLFKDNLTPVQNGHTTGQFHLNPDDRPQQRRFRLDTVSLRGIFNQQIHGSKRSLRSVEDFAREQTRWPSANT
jgi:hypothetical protein